MSKSPLHKARLPDCPGRESRDCQEVFQAAPRDDNRLTAARRWTVAWVAPAVALAAVALALGNATHQRNGTFRSPLALWRDNVEKRPTSVTAQDNLGLALVDLGKNDEAIEHYDEALRLNPGDALTHNNLGFLLTVLGRTDEAMLHYHQSLQLKPDFAKAHNNVGTVLVGLGQSEEAIEHFQTALKLQPDYSTAHNGLGVVLAKTGRPAEAIEQYRQALRAKPTYPEAHNNLAAGLADAGETGEAIEHYREALRLKPNYAGAQCNLGNLLARLGRTKEAMEQYCQLLQWAPDFVEAENQLAWLLATREPKDGGDAARAVQLAERARPQNGREDPQCLDTLAAAYAAAGRFPEAVTAAQQGIQRAASAGQTALAKEIQSRWELYRAGRPYRAAADRPSRSGP